jgi:hypothetical protein
MKILITKRISGDLEGSESSEEMPFLKKIQIFSESPEWVGEAITELIIANLTETSVRGILEFKVNLGICNFKAFLYFENEMASEHLINYLTLCINNLKTALSLAENLKIYLPKKFTKMLYSAYGKRMELYMQAMKNQELMSLDITERANLKNKIPGLSDISNADVFFTKLYSRDGKI